MKKKQILMMLIIASIMLTGVANARVDVEQVNYIGYDRYWNALDMQMIITSTEPTQITIVENYYSTDSSGNPKFYSSNRILDKETVSGMNDIQYRRPVDRHFSAYSQVETIVFSPTMRAVWWIDLTSLPSKI